MKHIGYIIKSYRKKIKMTQKQLGQDLCTVNYISLIETGDRTPSVDLLRRFSEKLGVDLFVIIQYIDCRNPIDVYETIRLFEKYRSNSDYSNLIELTKIKEADEDFQNPPWNCEIQINKYAYSMFIEGKISETIFDIQNQLVSLQKNNNLDKHIAQIYGLLSMAYLLKGNIKNAKSYIELANNLISNKANMTHYKHIYTTVQITALIVDLQSEKFDSVVYKANKLVEYQKQNNVTERIHYTFFHLAIANYKLGNIKAAVDNCLKVIFILLLEKKPYDFNSFWDNQTFVELINTDLIDKKIIKTLYQMYEFIPAPYQLSI